MSIGKVGRGYLLIGDDKTPVFVTEISASIGQEVEFRGHFCGRGGPLERAISDKKSAIKNVVFNDPATVVIWNDGTKTVVKCQPGDTYSKETGLALCIAKKYLGNKGNFNKVFKKWIPEEAEPVEEDDDPVEEDAVTGAVNLKRSGNISVGDTVRVVNSGQVYSGYSDWIELHVKDSDDASKWATKHGEWLNTGDIGVVKYIAPHEWRHEGDIAYVEVEGYCYIINVRGLEKVKEG